MFLGTTALWETTGDALTSVVRQRAPTVSKCEQCILQLDEKLKECGLTIVCNDSSNSWWYTARYKYKRGGYSSYHSTLIALFCETYRYRIHDWDSFAVHSNPHSWNTLQWWSQSERSETTWQVSQVPYIRGLDVRWRARKIIKSTVHQMFPPGYTWYFYFTWTHHSHFHRLVQFSIALHLQHDISPRGQGPLPRNVNAFWVTG
jgi:hypothetical protein